MGDGEDRRQVDVGGQPFGQQRDAGGRRGAFGRGHQTQVTRRSFDPGVAGQHAEHRKPGRLHGPDDLVGVPDRARLVQDHPAQPDLRVEGVEAVHDRRRRTRDLRDVQHQDHRSRDQAGDMRGGGEPLAADLSVEQPHHAFDHGDVGGSEASSPRAAAAGRSDLQSTGAGRGCGRGDRWPVRGNRGRCSPVRP